MEVGAPHTNGVFKGATADQPDSVLQMALGFLGLLRRHPFVILLFTLAAPAFVAYRARNELPVYQASAVVRIADKGRALSGGLNGGGAPAPPGMNTGLTLSQIQVLQSRGVATEVAQQEGLRLQVATRGLTAGLIDGAHVDDTVPNGTISLAFLPGVVSARFGNVSAQAPYGAPIELRGVRFKVPRRPTVESAELAVLPIEVAAGSVLGALRGTPRELTDIIDVSYTATDPALAQRVVNTAVLTFQQVNARTAKEESKRRREFIENRLNTTEMKLRDAQIAHDAFRSKERVYSAAERFKQQQQELTGVEADRIKLDASRRTYQTLLVSLQNAQRGAVTGDRLSALVASSTISSNSLIAGMFARLLALQASRDSMTTGQFAKARESPDVKKLDALIADQESQIVSGLQGQLTEIDARIASLDSLKARSSATIATLPASEAQESNLLADVETYRKEAERLREELQKASIDEAAEAGQVEIVDLATVPGIPIRTQRTPKFAVAILLGLVMGSALAYVLENRKSVIRNREHLERAVPVPNLALVPRIRAPRNGSSSAVTPLLNGNGNGKSLTKKERMELVTVTDSRSSGAEAYRTLRTNLLFSAAVQSLKRLVVTSPGPKEGKSTTSANLAITFAQQGHRVLLIDCDMRRPRVHKIFRERQDRGLSEVLLGEAVSAEATRKTGIDGLYVMPAGRIPDNPAELLGSAEMDRLIATLSETFDLLIFDTPPLLAASDAAILSKKTDGALVVVRAGHTEQGAILAAVHQLATVGGRILGTVLNDPDAEVPKYANFYGYYYNNYYDYSGSDA